MGRTYALIMIHTGCGQLTTRAPSSGRQQQRVLFLRIWATCLFLLTMVQTEQIEHLYYLIALQTQRCSF